jgi:hypothetical protein
MIIEKKNMSSIGLIIEERAASIGLSTLTYQFEGAIMHRDSIGSVAEITPGAVNWMTAGRDRLRRAKEDWIDQRFPEVPGETDFVPYPQMK